MADSAKTRILIAGGGVAAVEALLALHDVAGDRFDITLLTPKPELELRALAVATPFAKGRERRHFPLAPLVRECHATLVEGSLVQVVDEDKRVITAQGEAIGYDVLIVAVGARPRPAYDHVTTFGAQPLVLSGMLADIEEGYSRRIAFVVPPGVCWPLPAYELALMTRRQARSMGMDPEITIVTPELAPLAVFGHAASDCVAQLLAEAGIEIRTGARAAVGPSGRIGLQPGGEVLEFQRIISLPVVDGPAIAGLPQDEHGFVPIDIHAQVRRLPGVYCVGDAADHPLKQGGLATQQADAAALHIAASAGIRVTPEPFRPVLRGRLMTGGAEQFFAGGADGNGGTVSEVPLWWPPTKVSGRYLTPWIAAQDPDALPAEPREGTQAISQLVPAEPAAARRAMASLLRP